VDEAAFLDALSQCEGPHLAAGTTVADHNRFHDDLSTYTGVYAAGGPDTSEKSKLDLSEIMDRSESDVRGRKIDARQPSGRSFRWKQAAPHDEEMQGTYKEPGQHAYRQQAPAPPPPARSPSRRDQAKGAMAALLGRIGK
jgi:hypothetical protein